MNSAIRVDSKLEGIWWTFLNVFISGNSGLLPYLFNKKINWPEIHYDQRLRLKHRQNLLNFLQTKSSDWAKFVKEGKNTKQFKTDFDNLGPLRSVANFLRNQISRANAIRHGYFAFKKYRRLTFKPMCLSFSNFWYFHSSEILFPWREVLSKYWNDCEPIWSALLCATGRLGLIKTLSSKSGRQGSDFLIFDKTASSV